MATTLGISPTYPIEGETVTLTITGSPQDTFVFEITAVPSGSAIPLGFITQPLNVDNSVIAESNAQTVADSDLIGDSFTPDVAGEYSITVYEFRETFGYTAGHDADPQADARFDLIAVTDFDQAAGVVVGSYMELVLKTKDEDQSTLRLNVANLNVRVATMVSPTTEKARQAALNVTTELAALVGADVTTFGADLLEETTDLRDAFDGHRQQTISGAPPLVHAVADSLHVPREADARQVEGAIVLLNELRELLTNHLLDSSVQAAGSRWHSTDINGDDLKNVPICDKATTLAEATVLLSELRWRVYDRHRVQDKDVTGDAHVHTDPDTANTLTDSATALDDLIVAYLDAIAAQSPTAAANENQGAIELAHRFGFTRYTTG